jgi:hypothetical protein
MIFTLDPIESPAERVARIAREVGKAGPMGAYLDRSRYVEFLDGIWGNGEQLSLVKTSCAIVAGAVLGYAGHQLVKPWKADGSWGITSWINIGFNHPSWEEAKEGKEPEVGDVIYRGKPTGFNGHVQVVAEKNNDGWIVFEGGGLLEPKELTGIPRKLAIRTQGTVTRLSKPKNIFLPDGLGRRPAGWWKSNLFVPTYNQILQKLKDENGLSSCSS